MPDTDRLDALEIKCAHLERAVQELSDVLYRQQQEISRLLARNQELASRLEALAEAGAEAPASPFEIPPHY